MPSNNQETYISPLTHKPVGKSTYYRDQKAHKAQLKRKRISVALKAKWAERRSAKAGNQASNQASNGAGGGKPSVAERMARLRAIKEAKQRVDAGKPRVFASAASPSVTILSEQALPDAVEGVLDAANGNGDARAQNVNELVRREVENALCKEVVGLLSDELRNGDYRIAISVTPTAARALLNKLQVIA